MHTSSQRPEPVWKSLRNGSSGEGSDKSRKCQLDEESIQRFGYGLKIWCFSLLPDRVVPEGPCEPAGQWQGAVCGVQAGANACAQHTQSLHNGCGANDAPGDKNSLAPVRLDAWNSLPSRVKN